jgi:hypothetical protein
VSGVWGNEWMRKEPIKSHLRTQGRSPCPDQTLPRPRSQNVVLIGCQSVRQGLSFLRLRTDVRGWRSCAAGSGVQQRGARSETPRRCRRSGLTELLLLRRRWCRRCVGPCDARRCHPPVDPTPPRTSHVRRRQQLGDCALAHPRPLSVECEASGHQPKASSKPHRQADARRTRCYPILQPGTS